MSRKKKIVWGLSCVAVACGISLAAYGASSWSNSTDNVVEIGKVSIDLLTKEEEDAYETVHADEPLNRSVKVKNTGEYGVYVRLKVKKSWVGYEKGELATEEQLAGLMTPKPDAIDLNVKNGWVIGEQDPEEPDYFCYYYNQIVPKGETVDFMDTYQISTASSGVSNTLLKAYNDQSISLAGSISVKAEAIQADAFEPTKSGENVVGWLTEAPDPQVTATPYVNLDDDIESGSQVVFEPNDITFSNANGNQDSDSLIEIAGMIPGETKSTVVTLENTSGHKFPASLYAKVPDDFATLPEEEQKSQMELLNQLQLTVADRDGNIIYHGPLFEENSDKDMLSPEKAVDLGVLDLDEEKPIHVAVSCPTSWSKSDVKVKVSWVFGATRLPATPTPTAEPTAVPTPAPTRKPTETPVITAEPTSAPTDTPEPTQASTEEPRPTEAPTAEPVVTEEPTKEPTPTQRPNATTQVGILSSEIPAADATAKPTKKPTPTPTIKPTKEATVIEDIPEEDISGKVSYPTKHAPTATPSFKKKQKSDVVYPTKTGDVTPVFFWIACFLLSLVGCVYTARQLRR